MTQTSPSRLRVERTGPVAHLVIDNPARRNAVDLPMWREIPVLLARLDADPAIRVMILRGNGPFAAGADIAEFATLRATPAGSRDYERHNVAAFVALAAMAKPTVAMIRGHCLGAGMGLALACDMRVAATGSSFGIPAARLGVGYPPDAMPMLVAAVGATIAKDLFFTARRVGAEEALALGIINRLVADEDLETETDALALTIAQNAPLTIKAAKAAINACGHGAPGTADILQALADACYDSADYAEGRAAFREKRWPVFEGR